MKPCLLETIGATLMAVLATSTLAGAAGGVDRSTITQVVKSVSVLQPGTKAKKPAQVNEIFAVPEIMRTGPDSRAEMIAPDQTVTRVGANTLFSFEPEKREINLQKGSILFNSPTGKGGGTIKTAAATASVLGTTLIVVTTDNGGFKVLLQEGHGTVRTPKGRFRTLKAGQMVFALPGGDLSQVLTFHLSQQVGASLLVGGFKKPLPSIAKIEAAIAKQQEMIAKGQLVETGLLAGNEADKAFKVDVNAFEVLVKEERGANDPLTNALTSDAIVDAPQLERARIFLFDVSPFIVQSGTGESFSLSSNLTLFAARNTFFRTPTIDLAEFQPTQSFLFVSLQNFVVEQSVHILDTTSPIAFLAGGTFDFAPDVSLSTSAPAVFIFTIGGGLSADVAAGGTLTTGSGELVLTGHSSFISNDQSGGLLFVSVPALTLNDGAYLASNGDLTVSTAGDVNITGRVSFLQGAISATTGLFAANTLDVQAQGNVKLTDTFIQATSTTIVSQKDFNAANVVFDYGSSLSSSSTRLAATNLMSLNNTVFFTQDVSLQARTIALSNVQFAQGSSVTLRSQSGQLAPNPNTNQPVRLGDVNFIHNVQYGKAPAQNAVRGGSIVITK